MVGLKKVDYAKLVQENDDEERQMNTEEYKVARRQAKLAVMAAKSRTLQRL